MKTIIVWLISLFFKINKVAKVVVPIAVKFTQILKEAIDSGKVEDISIKLQNMLPEWGDNVVVKLEHIINTFVPKAALRLEIVKEINDEDDPIKKLSIIANKVIDGITEEQRQKLISQIAQEAAYLLADGDLSWADAGVFVKLFYEYKFKNK